MRHSVKTYIHIKYTNIQTSQTDGFKTDTISLATTQHEIAIFNIPWCNGQQTFTKFTKQKLLPLILLTAGHAVCLTVSVFHPIVYID